MYKKAPFVPKAFADLTKEELRSMVRCTYTARRTPAEMCEYYNVNPDDYCEGLREKGLSITSDERGFWWKYRESQEEYKKKEQERKHEQAEQYFLEYGHETYNIPKFVICAMFDVPYEVIDGKRYYDQEAIQRAKDKLDIKIREYMLGKNEPKARKEEYSNLRPIELVAMRMYRGLNRKQFSRKSGLNLSDIVETESKSSKVPRWIGDCYKDTLDIKASHVNQIRAILRGESDHVEEDRQISKKVKLQVWARDKGKCSRCLSTDKLHYHHIKRFSEGGQHTKENLTLLCAACHAEEHKDEKSYYMLKKIAEGDQNGTT